jgi:hypothetical protein
MKKDKKHSWKFVPFVGGFFVFKSVSVATRVFVRGTLLLF